MLAATSELAWSVKRATRSPGCTARHVSTALRAPGMRSACGEANCMLIILMDSDGFFLIAQKQAPRKSQHKLGPVLRSTRSDAEGGDLAAAAGDVGEAGGAQAREEAAKFAAEEIGSEIHQHVAEVDLSNLRDVGKNFAADGNPFLSDPHAVLC